MADEMNIEITSPSEPAIEIVFDENVSPACREFISRLEPFKTLSITTEESKKQIWLEFLSLWHEILQTPASEIQQCYNECARLIPLLIDATSFYTIRKDIHVARESCFKCINQLDQPRIKVYLNLTKEQQDLPENQIYYKHIYNLFLIASHTISFVSFQTVDDQKFMENHSELFILFIERVEKNMPEHFPDATPNNHVLKILNNCILKFFWNSTDPTVLIPLFLKCGLAKRVVSWLFQATMLTEKCRRSLISIAYNITRHDDGADEMNKYDAINAIKQYQTIPIENMDSRLLVCSMALAHLSTPEQLKRDKKGMNIVLNQLLQLVIHAAKGDRYRYNGTHVSEPLGVLVKIFVVEERTLDYVLCHAETEPPSDIVSTIQLFISLFFIFSDALKRTDRLEQFTLIALLNILWSISFQSNYSQELIKNEEFLTKIKLFSEDNNQQEILEQYKPRSMEGIQQAAHGILLNLNINDTKLNEHVDLLNSTNNKSWIMISYCHDNNIFCDEILEFLRTRNDAFEIWIDRTHCQGVVDLWESIADGMEQASIIVCLLSDSYFQSKSCRQEFIYAADSLKRRIVPILIENFEPKGWLGIRMTGMKYIRFRDLHQLEKNKMTELMNTILSSLPPSSKPTAHENRSLSLSTNHSINSNPVSPSLLDQHTSTNNDIDAWFTQHRISNELRNLFDFQSMEEMLNYAELLIKDREKQMNIYARIYAQKYHGNDMPPHEFNRFANALEQLMKEKRPSSSSLKSKSAMPNNSNVCVIS